MVTPIPRGIAMPLAASMAEDAVTKEHEIAELIAPGPRTNDLSKPRRRALDRQQRGTLDVTWDDDADSTRSITLPIPSV